MKDAIRVLVVDDQPAVRSGLHMRLSVEPDVTVVGEAEDGQRAVTMASELLPDIVVMDVGPSTMDGISATRAIRERCPRIAVILLALRGDPSIRTQAEAAGAAAFVEKSAGETALLRAVRSVARDQGKQSHFGWSASSV